VVSVASVVSVWVCVRVCVCMMPPLRDETESGSPLPPDAAITNTFASQPSPPLSSSPTFGHLKLGSSPLAISRAVLPARKPRHCPAADGNTSDDSHHRELTDEAGAGADSAQPQEGSQANSHSKRKNEGELRESNRSDDTGEQTDDTMFSLEVVHDPQMSGCAAPLRHVASAGSGLSVADLADEIAEVELPTSDSDDGEGSHSVESDYFSDAQHEEPSDSVLAYSLAAQPTRASREKEARVRAERPLWYRFLVYVLLWAVWVVRLKRLCPDIWWAATRPVSVRPDYSEIKSTVLRSVVVRDAIGYRLTGESREAKFRRAQKDIAHAAGRSLGGAHRVTPPRVLSPKRVKLASQMFDEMAANPKRPIIRVMGYLLRKAIRYALYSLLNSLELS
jgi:hypothetical protein